MEPIQKKRVAILGSHTFDDKPRLYDVLTKNRDRIKLIISNLSKGASTLAIDWCQDFECPYLIFPITPRDPFTGERNAGSVFRSVRMVIEQAEVVIFFDAGSEGTAKNIILAKELKKDIRIIKFTPPLPKTSEPVDLLK